jgi:hypothetical protein
MDEFKRHIKGWRKNGKVCPCCAEYADKQQSRRTARRRLVKFLREAWSDANDPFLRGDRGVRTAHPSE